MGFAFPLSGVFFCCPAKVVLATWIFGVTLLLVMATGHKIVAEVSVVVATTACRSLYLLYMFFLSLFVCLTQHKDFS